MPKNSLPNYESALVEVENASIASKPKKRIGTIVWVIIVGFLAGIAGSTLLVFVILPMFPKNSSGLIMQTTEKLVVKEDSTIIDSVKKVSPSVVSITFKSYVLDFFGDSSQQTGGGTGFIISKDGYILTNRHVISDEDADYTVFLSDGRNFSAKVVSLDPLTDLGVVKIEADDLPVVDLGDSDVLEIGQRVIAVGNALAEFQNTVTTGVISAKNRTISASDSSGYGSEELQGLLQTDTAINPGNSGGPLLNLEGQVIGINTAIASQAQNIGFAIPINQAKSAITSVLQNGKITRPFLGVRYVTLTKQIAELNKYSVSTGALVVAGNQAGEYAVQPGSPADKVGIKSGDIIIKIGGKTLDENSSLVNVLLNFSPNQEVEVVLNRDGKELTVKLTLGESK